MCWPKIKSIEGIIKMTKLFDQSFLSALMDKASKSPRRRAHHLLSSHSDNVQRVVCAMKKGSYFRVHKHPQDNKWELISILQGHFQFLSFDDSFRLDERIALSPESCPVIQAPSKQWHTFIVLEDSVFMEVKEGPFKPEDKIDFADWSPEEGDPNVPSFLEQLKKLKHGEKLTD